MSNEKWSEWFAWDRFSGYPGDVNPNTQVEVQNDDYDTIDSLNGCKVFGRDIEWSEIVAYRYRMQENEMRPDLKWLAENVSEWPKAYIFIKRDTDFPLGYNCSARTDLQGRHNWTTQAEWLQARKDIGLIMSDDEESLPAEDWSTTITDTPEEAAMVEDMVEVHEALNPKDFGCVPMSADKYSAYFKDVRHINTTDVYRVVSLFECERHGHPISHAAKKLLLSGSRTGGKDVESDVREAIDTLYRWLEMREEDQNAM